MTPAAHAAPTTPDPYLYDAADDGGKFVGTRPLHYQDHLRSILRGQATTLTTPSGTVVPAYDTRGFTTYLPQTDPTTTTKVETNELRWTRFNEDLYGKPGAGGSRKGMWLARARAGMLLPLRAFGTIGLVSGAASLGWKIGRTIDTHYLHLSGVYGAPPTDTTWYNAAEWHWKEATLAGGTSIPAGWYLWHYNAARSAPCANLPTTYLGGNPVAASSSSCKDEALKAQATRQSEFIDANGPLVAAGMVQIRVDGEPGTSGADGFCNSAFGYYCTVLHMPAQGMEEVTVVEEWDPQGFDRTFPAGAQTKTSTHPVRGSASDANHADCLDATCAEPDASAGRTELQKPTNEDAKKTTNNELHPDDSYPLPWNEPIVLPDCTGLSQAACDTALNDAGFTGTRTYVTLPRDGARLDLAPSTVVTTTPAPGTLTAPDTALELELNPSTLPLEMPQPNPNETHTAYTQRLRDLGWIGTVTVNEVTTAEPGYGPDSPTRIATPTAPTASRVLDPLRWPTPLPRINPDEPLTVWKNPPTAQPVPTGGGDGPGLDFTPVTGIDWGCKFPFGLITCYAIPLTEVFNPAADAPSFTFTFDGVAAGAPGGPYNLGSGTVDLNVADDYMAKWRALLSVAIWVGAVYLLAARLLGFRSTGDPGEAVDDVL